MLRSSTVFLLILSLLSANLSRYFVYVGFEFNKNYIAANLCENRDKPVMQCLGKCYLSKKLKQEAQKEKSQERDSKKSHFQEADIITRMVLICSMTLIPVNYASELPFALPSHSTIIFHPPKV